jgi:hypothetical protein
MVTPLHNQVNFQVSVSFSATHQQRLSTRSNRTAANCQQDGVGVHAHTALALSSAKTGSGA